MTREEFEEKACEILYEVEFKDEKAIAQAVSQLANYLEHEEQVKNCSIPDVSQQRELLLAYELRNIEYPNIVDKEVAKKQVEEYLANNCG